MGWTETHRYYAALRDVERALDRGHPLPWRAGYEEIFGDREGLLLALSRRWRVLVEAWDDGEPWPASIGELAGAHPGLVAALRRYGYVDTALAAGGAGCAPEPGPGGEGATALPASPSPPPRRAAARSPAP